MLACRLQLQGSCRCYTARLTDLMCRRMCEPSSHAARSMCCPMWPSERAPKRFAQELQLHAAVASLVLECACSRSALQQQQRPVSCVLVCRLLLQAPRQMQRLPQHQAVVF